MYLRSSEMLIDNSTFTDNSALYVNHGLSLITAKLEIRESTISFTEGFAETLNLERLDTGFFDLFLGSTLYIKDNSVISNLKA